MTVELDTSISTLELRNPLMNAAGILGTTKSLLKRVARCGVGAVVTKAIDMEQNTGNPNPVVVEVRGGILNCMGGTSPGIQESKKELIALVEELEIPIIANIVSHTRPLPTPEQYANLASTVADTGVSMIEVDVSCAHTAPGQIGKDPYLSMEVTKAVKNTVHVPVMVKLTPNVTDIVEIARAVEQAGADAICAINTLGPGMAIDIETGRPLLGGPAGVGGMSGPAIRPIAVRCVAQIVQSVKVPVVGCGGVTDGQSAIEMLMAGASAVQIGTAIIYEGLGLFRKITKEIEKFLERKGYRSLDEIIGLTQQFLG